MKCPGQDRRYWTADSVFEVPCPHCGGSVEFFKDEAWGRCRGCGHRFANPGADFGCAAWCSLAKECVGFMPNRGDSLSTMEGALAARLLQEVNSELAGHPTRLAHAVKAFQYAKELVTSEGGDPRVILPAALLLDLAGPDTDGSQPVPADLSSRTGHILRRVGLDEATANDVCRILASRWAGQELDTLEFRVVCDASDLASLAPGQSQPNPDKPQALLEGSFKTESARQKARSLLQA